MIAHDKTQSLLFITQATLWGDIPGLLLNILTRYFQLLHNSQSFQYIQAEEGKKQALDQKLIELCEMMKLLMKQPESGSHILIN